MKRTTLLCALTTFSLLALPALPASAQLPRKAAPRGMREVPTGTSGRILTTKMDGTRSAHKMMLALKMVSKEYFDGPFKTTRAFSDQNDQHVQVAFTAKLKGTPVRGIAAVAMEGNSGQGTLIFDNANTLSKSFKTLIAKQSSGGGAKGKAAVKLTPTLAPDGSCKISLPSGYRITGAYKGTLDIVGPNGAAMSLGGPHICTRPEAARMFPGIPPVNFNDPIRAALDFVSYTGRQSGQTSTIKVIDWKPVPNWTSGRAAYVRYSVVTGGKSMQGFGLFAIMPTDVNQAVLYMSYMAAPDTSYKSQFPGMLAAWGTWSVNPAVFKERLMAAAQSLRGMSDIITSSYNYSQSVNAKVNEAWSDVMRDRGTWENPDNGNRYKISNVYTNNGAILTENGTQLVPVPLSDL
jgi:hypothetical protein